MHLNNKIIQRSVIKFNPTNMRLCIGSLFLFFVLNVHGQNIMMSSVGVMNNTLSNATAVKIKSNTSCINVQSGIAVLNGTTGLGEFTVNCNVEKQFNTIGMSLFPNPARTLLRAKFNHSVSVTEIFNVGIWNTSGAIISSRKESGFSIYQGIMIDVSGLNAGTYILKMESSNFVEATKFIKAN